MYARARSLLNDRHGRRIEEEDSAATAVAAVSLGVGEPDPDAEVAPAHHWRPHLAAIEAGLGRELAVRLRASELAQAAFFAADGAGERERIVQLHTLDEERGDWIRWAGTKDRLQDLAEGLGGGCSGGSAARLAPVLALARGQDDEQLRTAVWATRWHEAERRSARLGGIGRTTGRPVRRPESGALRPSDTGRPESDGALERNPRPGSPAAGLN